MKCSKCGNSDLFYKYFTIGGQGMVVYNSDGNIDKSGYNDEMYEYLPHKELKDFYCVTCNNKLSKKDIEKK